MPNTYRGPIPSDASKEWINIGYGEMKMFIIWIDYHPYVKFNNELIRLYYDYTYQMYRHTNPYAGRNAI